MNNDHGVERSMTINRSLVAKSGPLVGFGGPETTKKRRGGEINMTGQDKAREVAEKLRGELDTKAVAEQTEIATVKHELDMVRDNPELVKLYNDNAKVGSENLGSDLPQLKVHATGKSTSNQMADGSEPSDGWFFYKPTGQQFQTITAHILSISRGFRAEGMNGQKDVFNQIMSGVIVNDGEQKPFITYFTGTKLQKFWEFGKEAGKYTHAKPVSIPLFALTVKLGTEKVETTFGKSWVVNFTIVKNEIDEPVVVTDVGEFVWLRDMVDMMNETVEKVIAAKVVEDTVAEVKKIESVAPSEQIPF